MKKKRLREEQSARILRQAEAAGTRMYLLSKYTRAIVILELADLAQP